jgi:hypothetical protein
MWHDVVVDRFNSLADASAVIVRFTNYAVPPEKRGIFLWLLRPKILDYAPRFLKKSGEICAIFMQFLCDEIAGTCEKMQELAKNAAFRWHSRRVLTSLDNVPMATGEMAAFVWSKRNIFNTFCWKLYVTFLQRKCGDYEIMQAPRILRGNLQFMRCKCGIFEKMRPPHEYADFGW